MTVTRTWTGRDASGQYAVRPWYPEGPGSLLPWSLQRCTGCQAERTPAPVGLKTAPVEPFPEDSARCDRIVDTFSEVNDRVLYGMRASTNGRSMAWGQVALGELLGGASTALYATWMADGLSAVVVATFNGDDWTRTSTTTVCGGAIGDLAVGEVTSPNVASRDTTTPVVAWLQNASNDYLVCGAGRWVATVDGLALDGRKVLWDIGDPGPGPDGAQAGVRYLSAALGSSMAAMAVSAFEGSSGYEAWAATWPGGVVAMPLTYFNTATVWPMEDSSDPSVATSPDGNVTVWAWEEGAAMGVAGAPRGKFIMYMVRVKGVPAQWFGPFIAQSAMGDVGGSEPSVAVTEQGIYIGFQVVLESGGPSVGEVHLIGLRRSGSPHGADETYDGTEVWERVAASAYTPPALVTGRVGQGWLPNVSARTVDGEDLIAVVWEDTDLPFGILTNNTVGLAFVHSAPGLRGGFFISGTRSMARPDVTSSTRRWQLGAAVSVGPPTLFTDYVPVDVMWMDVDTAGAPSQTQLRHRRYAFDGRCR